MRDVSFLETIGGFLAACVLLGAVNFFTGLAVLAFGSNVRPMNALIMAAPGVILAMILQRFGRSDVAQGAMIATVIITLIGGLCGYTLVGSRIGG